MAATKFLLGIQVPVRQMIKAQLVAQKYVSKEKEIPKEHRIPSKKVSEFLIRQELLPITEYDVDVEFFRNRKDTFVIAAGTYAKDKNTFLFQTAQILAERCGLSTALLPGHHGSFMDDPINWAKRLKELLGRMRNC